MHSWVYKFPLLLCYRERKLPLKRLQVTVAALDGCETEHLPDILEFCPKVII